MLLKNIKMKIIQGISFVFLTIFLVCLPALGQEKTKSYSFTTKKLLTISPNKPSEDEPDFAPILIHNPNLNSIKGIASESIEVDTDSSEDRTFSGDTPKVQVIDGFEGPFDGNSVPNDDGIAVSNNGDIMVVRNSRIAIYNSQHELISNRSLFQFTSSLQIIGPKYDPRIIYDQDEDRFILVLLTGYNHTTNEVIVCFSKTNDPSGEWNFYSIKGNLLEDNTWSDYPTIAINNENLYISITNFADLEDFSTWDFYGARIIQINKQDGYLGEEDLEFGYHVVNPGFDVSIPSEIHYYNVIPVKGGKTQYGPAMYFLSTLDCPFPDIDGNYPPKDTLFLLKVSGNNEDDFLIESTFIQTPVKYAMPVRTEQPEGLFLQTNYNTIKDAYYENGIINFVMNSIDFSNNQAGILHGKISDVEGNNDLQVNLISYDTLGLGYATIAYIDPGNGSDAAVICFNYTSPDYFPGNACVIYENNSYSDLTILKEGTSVINMLDSPTDRWGDYTTVQVKYNEPNIAYFSGSYGQLNQQRTWISKLLLPLESLDVKEIKTTKTTVKVYPNPTKEVVHVQFEIDQPQICYFNLYDGAGKLMQTVYAKKVKPGTNLFSMNLDNLPKGHYTIEVKGDKGFHIVQKVLVD